MTAVPVSHLDAIGSIPPGLLYPHQADGVAFLISKKRAILADDMGLGKTRQAIVALEWRRGGHSPRRLSGLAQAQLETGDPDGGSRSPRPGHRP